METTNSITSENIKRVYSGKHGCACGCRGKHSEAKGSITRVVNTMNRIAEETGKPIEIGGNHYAIETETRVYVAYFD